MRNSKDQLGEIVGRLVEGMKPGKVAKSVSSRKGGINIFDVNFCWEDKQENNINEQGSPPSWG